MSDDAPKLRRVRLSPRDVITTVSCAAVAIAIVAACFLVPVADSEQIDAGLLEINSVPGIRLWWASLILGPIMGFAIGCLDGRRIRLTVVGGVVGTLAFGGAFVIWLLRVLH